MADAQTRSGAAPATSRKVKVFAAVGVLAAAMLAVNANVLVARWYKRWDLTRENLYSLSPATIEILRGLDQKISILVFLGRGDPLSVSVRHLLQVYAAETGNLEAQFIDPDQNPAEFLAMQQKFGLLAGKAEDGRIITDASIVLSSGEKHWFITSDDIVGYDDGSGRARPRLEQALTSGLASLLRQDKVRACFSTGHRELAREDTGPEGLNELVHRLEKNNFEIETIDLTAQNAKTTHCRVLVIAAPRTAFASAAAERVRAHVGDGGNLLLLVPPFLDENQRVQRSGFESVLSEFGIELGKDLILESDEARRLPRGSGEVFFATPSAHTITKGLIATAGNIESRVLVSEARSVRPSAGSSATTLLTTSDQAIAIEDVRALTEPNHSTQSLESAPRGAFALGVATELPRPTAAKSEQEHGPRLVVFGTASLVWARNYRDPALYGNRLMIENAFSWLTTSPPIVSVPEKHSHEIGLSLSEEALGEVLRYVLIYMPGCAVLLGVFVILRRRKAEQQSRNQQSS